MQAVARSLMQAVARSLMQAVARSLMCVFFLLVVTVTVIPTNILGKSASV